MILCDAGPLIAMIDQGDEHHEKCVDALARMPLDRFVTTWPCLAEAMYLLGSRGGFSPKEDLWTLVEDGLVVVDAPEPGEGARMRVLMRQYRDLPMDLADASLVTAAERLGARKVFTIDHHFRVYRINGHEAFVLVA
jgi:uncharacterized protein